MVADALLGIRQCCCLLENWVRGGEEKDQSERGNEILV